MDLVLLKLLLAMYYLMSLERGQTEDYFDIRPDDYLLTLGSVNKD